MSAVHSLGHAVDIFEGELARRGRTEATKIKYRQILYPFSERFREKLPWEITAYDCRSYLDQWTSSSPATLGLHISILNVFFTFLWEEEIIEANPMARIRRPPKRRYEDLDVVSVSESDVSKLYDAIETWPEMICLGLLTYMGPRRSAAANARRSDVDLQAGTIRFHEKGGKLIVKPIPHRLRAILRAAEQNGVWASPRDYLIPNRRPGSTSQKARSNKIVWYLVKQLEARSGVSVHPHALRAAFAVRYLETHPGDTDALQKLMGHAHADTTQIYLRKQDRFKAMERVRDLSWDSSLFPSSAATMPSESEPVLSDSGIPKPLARKLKQLRTRNSQDVRR